MPSSSPTAVETATIVEEASTSAPQTEGSVRIAVIGDYGLATPAQQDVAELVKSWRPDLVITTGDNNYPSGSPETIDLNIGRLYHDFIAPYSGQYGAGAERNRFLPTLGNHDWQDPDAQAYLDYFTLPGNERYYEVAWGPVHLFALDSMPGEPDGIKATSEQAAWLREGLAMATEPWKLVAMHHPPFSSGPHGSTEAMQWPYGEWGATAVLAGHDHTYERIARDGTVYFVNGLGGSIKYEVGQPVQGSQVRYDDDFGAMLIEADEGQITFRFLTRSGRQVDEYTITR
jgi:tartrate-resistant acid phosphatase type 5